MAVPTRGALVEYALAVPPLTVVFDFNPQSISRTRSITISTSRPPGNRGYDFMLPTDTPRIAQGVSTEPESFTVDVMFDATDRMGSGDAIASRLGVQPELDTLRTMVEPKFQGPAGLRTLIDLDLGEVRAFQRNASASVLLFVWGSHLLPVFLTSVKIDEIAHLPSLAPYRANASLSMQVIESENPFYIAEKVRQMAMSALSSAVDIASVVTGI